MVWNRIALVSLLLVVLAAGQCDEGTCQSLQPYFNCPVNFDEGAAGAGNTMAFAVCTDIGDVVVRVGFVRDSHFEHYYVNALQVLEPHLGEDGTFYLPNHLDHLPAEERFVETAFLAGLWSALRSRPLRPIHLKREVHSELLWRENLRRSVGWVFDIVGPAASCMYCFNDTAVASYLPLCKCQPGDAAGWCRPAQGARLPFALEVEVMTRARPVGPSIPQMTISQLLVLLTGYTMDLQKMTYLGFLHDNHFGNLLLVGTGQTQSRMAWHDFGARSYFQNATTEQFESFREHFDMCYDTVIEHLTRRGTVGLIEELGQIKSEWSLQGIVHVRGVSDALATLAEKLQQVIMQWADGSIDIRRSVLRAWSRALTPTRAEELRDFLERGATSAPSTVWVRELDSKEGAACESKCRARNLLAVGRQDDHRQAEAQGGFRLPVVLEQRKAIKQKNPVSLRDIDARHIYIYLYSQEAGAWQLVRDESEVLRQNTSRLDCYGFLPRRAT
ncbi:unnamed protein product [Symbiodinium sp. CCMP2592]|nr:unnamed protein product [Symbiodinium sp. CCMP2592]